MAALSTSEKVMVPKDTSETIKPVPPRLLYRIGLPSALSSDIVVVRRDPFVMAGVECQSHVQVVTSSSRRGD